MQEIALELSPYIRYAKDEWSKGPWHMKQRVIYDYEIMYILEGTLTVTVEDKEYITGKGDIFLFRPNRRHSLRCCDQAGFRQPHVHFDLIRRDDSKRVGISFKNRDEMTEEEIGMIRPDILVQNGIDLPDKLHISDIVTFQKLLFDVIYEYENQMPYSYLSAQGAFLRLWAFILQQHMHHESFEALSEHQLLQEIRQHLNVNTDILISLDDLAAQYNISKFHLSHTFREAFGVSPIQYHLHCRLEKARSMVLYTQHTLTSIAEEAGFSCLNDFSRAFKKKYHISPRELRKE